MTAGHTDGAVYILLSGTTKICAIGGERGDLIVSLCGPGEILGEMSALDGQGHSASIMTLEPSVAGSMHRSHFLQFLEQIPRFSYNVMLNLVRRVRLATAHLQSVALNDISGQVARQLLAFARAHGIATPDGEIQIPFRLTQQDLADTIGASRVRVQQVLKEYEKAGYIRAGRCMFTGHTFRITVCNPSALEARCFQSYNS